MIRKILAVIPVFLVLLYSCSRSENVLHVPDAVQAALLAQYPDATNVNWYKDGDNYEAEFTVRGESVGVYYEADGTTVKDDSE